MSNPWADSWDMGTMALSACRGALKSIDLAVHRGGHHVVIAGHAELFQGLGDAEAGFHLTAVAALDVYLYHCHSCIIS